MKHMIAILTWLGLSAGMLHAHYFDVAIVVPPGDGQAAMQAFLLASAERDGHPDETSDGHLGGLDSHVTIVENGDHADAQGRCCTDRVSSVNTGFCHDHGYA